MLPSDHRLSQKGDFDQIFKKGAAFRSKSLNLRYLKRKEGNFRVAIVVSAKVSKKAVVRNHLRRQISEAVRLNKPKDSYDLVFIVKPGADKLKSADLRSEVVQILTKTRLKSDEN